MQDLPLEILEIIGGYLPAHSYCNFRESCRNTACLGPVAKLNLKAFKQSVKGWTTKKGKRFKKLFSCKFYDYNVLDAKMVQKDKFFYENVQLKATEYSSSALEWMREYNVGEEVIRMIRHDERFLSPLFKTKAKKRTSLFILNWACFQGYTDVVNILLQYPWIDPTLHDEKNISVIDLAIKKGHLEIVKLLLEDSRIDPSEEGSFVLGLASEYGHLDIVQLLLQCPQVDPSDKNNYSIIFASQNGHLDIVALLLQDSRVDPTVEDNYAIQIATENGHLDVVRDAI